MRKFVFQELSGSEFVNLILYQILNDKKELNCLKKDFKRQKKLKLNTKIFQFLIIISDIVLALEAFNKEPQSF